MIFLSARADEEMITFRPEVLKADR
jgi:hypothetical protein